MNIYKQRRETLSKKLNDGECIFIFSGKEIPASEDECYPFKVNRNFYYLTGITKQNMILCIRNTADKITETMFIEEYDELKAKWVAPRLRDYEVKEISEVDSCLYLESFKDYINNIFLYNQSKDGMNIYLDLWHYNTDQDDSEAYKFAKYLKQTYVNVTIKDIRNDLAKMRMIKDELEIENISKAIHITKNGIESMMRVIRPNLNEMVLEKAFELSLAQYGCKQVAFPTIAAGGNRATTLHYSENNQKLEDNTLFLCDLGATYDNYCADISRTFPVNGKFTERQKEIYNVVLNVQKLVEESAKPGVSLRELQAKVIAYYKEELPKIGLTKDVSEYYFHGIGHHLGLDTHDITSLEKTVLEKGMVITNEPGLYISDEGIGIRIEDDLLITEDGCINLAKDILHTTEDIETFMKK